MSNWGKSGRRWNLRKRDLSSSNLPKLLRGLPTQDLRIMALCTIDMILPMTDLNNWMILLLLDPQQLDRGSTIEEVKLRLIGAHVWIFIQSTTDQS